MNISIKDILLSFAIGLIVFSLLMLVICVGIFKSDIDVALSKSPQQGDKQMCEIHKAVIFVVPQSNGEGLKMAVLAAFDQENRELLLTPVYGDYLMNYRNSLSYVESVYNQNGKLALSELFKSISSIEVATDDIIDTQNAINFAEFKEQTRKYFSENEKLFDEVFETATELSSIQFKDIFIVTTEQITENTHQHINIINVDETVERFKNIIR